MWLFRGVASSSEGSFFSFLMTFHSDHFNKSCAQHLLVSLEEDLGHMKRLSGVILRIFSIKSGFSKQNVKRNLDQKVRI